VVHRAPGSDGHPNGVPIEPHHQRARLRKTNLQFTCDEHQAAARDSLADPVDQQVKVGTEGYDVRDMCRAARRIASLSRLLLHRAKSGRRMIRSTGTTVSRAAPPEIRTLGPSAHQIGPSPFQTATGVHWNVQRLLWHPSKLRPPPWALTERSDCQLGTSPAV
jgi:hypothetical protein